MAKLGERFIKLNALKAVTKLEIRLIDHCTDGVAVSVKNTEGKWMSLVMLDIDRPTVDEATDYIKEQFKDVL